MMYTYIDMRSMQLHMIIGGRYLGGSFRPSSKSFKYLGLIEINRTRTNFEGKFL